jgi:hypothetical protein
LPRKASTRNYTGGKPLKARYDDDENLAKVIGENMAKLLDLRPSTVIDMSCYTVPVHGPRREEWGLGDSPSPFPIPSASPASPLEECPGTINRHATRLVMSPDALLHTIDACEPQIEVSRLNSTASLLSQPRGDSHTPRPSAGIHSALTRLGLETLDTRAPRV